MKEEIQLDEKVLEAFHLMFDNYPAAAQLTHKSKRIMALNPACRAMGRDVGMICAKHGPPEAHQGCLAAKMLKERKPQWAAAENTAPGVQNMVVFWLPIDGHPDFYIHFAVAYPFTPACPAG